MVEAIPQVVAGLLTLIVGGVGTWVWNISSKVTVLETKESTAKLLLEARDESLRELLEEKFGNIDHRLARIERAMNGRLHGGEHGRSDR